jgi:hypothetical protein
MEHQEMDISDAILKIQQEIHLYKEPPSEIVSLQFQNHLYGCCTVLELLAEDDEDVSQVFSRIGCEYGFLHDTRTEYTGWSNSYCNAWKVVWDQPFETLNDLVERVETAILGVLPDGFRFFKGALDTGELSADAVAECERVFETAKQTVKQKRRGTEFTRRAKGVRRTITPISRRQPTKGRIRTFHLTRRRSK